jgi:hypothetical protein
LLRAGDLVIMIWGAATTAGIDIAFGYDRSDKVFLALRSCRSYLRAGVTSMPTKEEPEDVAHEALLLESLSEIPSVSGAWCLPGDGNSLSLTVMITNLGHCRAGLQHWKRLLMVPVHHNAGATQPAQPGSQCPAQVHLILCHSTRLQGPGGHASWLPHRTKRHPLAFDFAVW